MPDPGDVKAGGVYIGVDADLSPLKNALTQATTDAKQQGIEIGKAIGDGMAQGQVQSQSGVSGPGIGGGIGGVGGGFAGGGAGGFGGGVAGPGMGGAAAGAGGAVPVVVVGNTAGGGGSGGSGGGAGPLDNPIQGAATGYLIHQMIAVADKFEQIGEKIGEFFSESTRAQLQLAQAMSQLSMSIGREQKTTAGVFNEQASGVGGRKPGTEVLELYNSLQDANLKLEGENAKDFTKTDAMFEIGADLVGVQTAGIYRPRTPREQRQDQIDANNKSMDGLRGQRNGLIQAGRTRSIGAAVAEADDFLGIPHPSNFGNVGETLRPEVFTLFVEELKRNRQAAEQLTTAFRSFQGQGQLIRQTRTQGHTQ